jgi:UDPglucose--hexose-1-phosphate uridylyltransferase
MSIEPEFRRDPVSGRWTVIAPERAHRPKTLEGAEPRHRRNVERQPCPFCPGQEYDTPNEVLAYRPSGTLANGPGWQLRVVPNKFPAVQPELDRETFGSTDREPFQRAPGFGRAEVVIECPEHYPDPTFLSDAQFASVFQAYRDRITALSHEKRLNYASVFKNVGAEAGASLGHSHSQIIAVPILPGLIQLEITNAVDFYSRTGRCVFCDIVSQELAERHRLIAQSENYLAIAAYAPRFDREFWVLPRRHGSRYETISNEGSLELAQFMKRVLTALDRVLDQPAYNWFLHTAPLRSPELPHYHWHIEVLPRTARPAGLEWGFGLFMASVSPEETAANFRRELTKS